jgi:hypothetical protein
MTKVFLLFSLVFGLSMLSSCALSGSNQKSNLDALQSVLIDINEKIKEVFPSPNGTAAPNVKIKITFNEQKMIRSASGTIFTLRNQLGEIVPGEFSFNFGLATFTPNSELRPGNYRITVGNLMAGNTLMNVSRSWSFQVIEQQE